MTFGAFAIKEQKIQDDSSVQERVQKLLFDSYEKSWTDNLYSILIAVCEQISHSSKMIWK